MIDKIIYKFFEAIDFFANWLDRVFVAIENKIKKLFKKRK